MSASISKTVTHKIRMGPYETFEVGTTVEMFDVEDTDAALDAIDALIANALDPDVKQARELAVPDSYIHDWGKK